MEDDYKSKRGFFRLRLGFDVILHNLLAKLLLLVILSFFFMLFVFRGTLCVILTRFLVAYKDFLTPSIIENVVILLLLFLLGFIVFFYMAICGELVAKPIEKAICIALSLPLEKSPILIIRAWKRKIGVGTLIFYSNLAYDVWLKNINRIYDVLDVRGVGENAIYYYKGHGKYIGLRVAKGRLLNVTKVIDDELEKELML